jgi:hypothetical protein
MIMSIVLYVRHERLIFNSFGLFIWSIHLVLFIWFNSFGLFIWSIHLVYSFGSIHLVYSYYPSKNRIIVTFKIYIYYDDDLVV